MTWTIHQGDNIDILKNFDGINLTLLEVNSGYAGGNNLAIKKAILDNYKFLFLFNPDSILTSKIIDSMIDISEKNNALVGPVIFHADSKNIQSIGGTFNPFFSHFNVSKKVSNSKDKLEVDWILGAALMIPSKVIKVCGFLDEQFFPATLEESSYCMQAKNKGFKSIIDLGSSVDHKGGTSSGGDKKYLLRLIKNRYYYALRYQNLFFFCTTIVENSLRYIYHKVFGLLKN